MPKHTTETRQFTMHPRLLFDVIQRQAGSLAKALLEGVQNSVDAGAARCEITLDASHVTIADDGRGFQSRQEIEDWFETFGQPHAEGERKVYGTFRMGRGQIFSFGRNTWRSGRFRMDVDVKGRGLAYDLQTGLRNQAGCTVHVALYKKLLPSELAETVRQVTRWVKYVPILVLLNGERISSDPAGREWDHETEDAWIRFKGSGGLAVYNLGVLVCEQPRYVFGTGGEVVSKKQLKVNFARNDIQSDCPVWRRIKKIVDRFARRDNLERAALDDDARQRFADQLRRGELEFGEDGAGDLRLFTAVNGRNWSAAQLAHEGYVRTRYSSGPKGDRRGDRLHQQKAAFIFAEETIERFGFRNARELVNWLRKVFPGPLHDRFPSEYVPFEELTAGISESYEILPEKEHTPNERVWLKLARNCARVLYDEIDPVPSQRRILVGTSEAADGWTDGRTYVALGREFLRRQSLDVAGFCELGHLLLHELCHDGPDTAEHAHSQEFYERYHNAHAGVSAFTAKCLAYLPTYLETEGRRLTRAQLKTRDKLERARRSLPAAMAR